MCWPTTPVYPETVRHQHHYNNTATSSMEGSDNSNLTSGNSSDSNLPGLSQTSGSCEEDGDQEGRGLDVFYFESDHLALKGNKDYHTMMRTICQLEAQRMQATRDIEKLIECEKQACADPIKFVEQLQNRVDLGLPEPIRVPLLPNVHWEKYTSSVDPLSLAYRKHTTRKRPAGAELHAPSPSGLQDMTTVTAGEVSGSGSVNEEVTSGSTGVQLVRGRIKDQKKAVTFNQLWTAEEQKRLEELLIIHGPEPVEARRWAKIATALGNRTTQQVASRVQKYFIRLAKAGLPIPGRMPNLAAHLKKGSTHRHQRYNRMYFQQSTFLQSHLPPVYMTDHEEDYDRGLPGSGMRYTPNSATDEVSDEEDVPPEKRLTVEYQELMQLKRLLRKKLSEQRISEHIGYKCDQCGCEPIVGTRWHCADCPEEVSVDFCDECMDCQFDNGTHQPHHKLEPVHAGGGTEGSGGGSGERRHVDKDYLQGTQPGHYNYLDPNYMPAS